MRHHRARAVMATAAALAFVSACAFAVHAVRTGRAESGFLCLLALGVASGIKIFAAPVALLLALVLVARGRHEARTRIWLGAGALAGALAVLPWLVRTWQLTGHPLSPLPVEFAGVELGVANDALRWYIYHPAT